MQYDKNQILKLITQIVSKNNYHIMIEYVAFRRENNYIKITRQFAKINKSFTKAFSIFVDRRTN